MIKALFSRYNPLSYSAGLAFMLQSVEYQPKAFIDWYGRTRDFSSVMVRRELVVTKAAILFRLFIIGTELVLLAGAVWCMTFGSVGIALGVLLLLLMPFIAFVALLTLLLIAREFIAKPQEKKALGEAQGILSVHKATIIAVAGSYGKTSMKELLLTILSEGKKTAATPANMNVATSHAKFARNLNGEEDVVILEFGEGKPGDVQRFSEMAGADMAVITGLAPAHLDQYGTMDDAAKDIMTVAGGKQPDSIYMNTESPKLKMYYKEGFHAYDATGCGSVRISNIRVGLEKTLFTMTIGTNAPIEMSTGLLGAHNLGPLAAAAEIGTKLGLTPAQISAGIAKTKPFEHRMQSRKLAGGAWIIDDTYNGNIEGLRAGLALLKSLPSNRKWYITPGLVDQGPETIAVHRELGALIASAAPTVVVLMKNSVTNYIVDGLREAMYTGEVRTESDPLKFYTNIESYLAAGDIALLQNDWTDNYN